jgi:hypothetical protein
VALTEGLRFLDHPIRTVRWAGAMLSAAAVPTREKYRD